jgi:hypothetical protein
MPTVMANSETAGIRSSPPGPESGSDAPTAPPLS